MVDLANTNILDDGTRLWAVPADMEPFDFRQMRFVLDKSAVSPEYVNLLSAASSLYRTNLTTQATLTSLVDILEEAGADALVEPIMTLIASLNVSQKMAELGAKNYVDKYADKG